MNNMRLILIDDDDQEVCSCTGAVQDFNEANKCDIQLETCKTIQSALKALESSYFDGAIIDMRLGDSGNEGNQALDVIRQHLKRIPVAIYTGNPDVADVTDIPSIGLFKKADITYEQLIYKFWDIYKTGLTKIMGGKGQIEQSLSQIFIKHLLPEIVTVLGNGSASGESNWVRYAKINSHETEEALLRHTINHLTHELYKSDGKCYPDEMLIRLLEPIPINTGCILKHKESGIFYIVMSPACDLAERKSESSEGESRKCNTDRAMLVEIQNLDDILNNNEKYKKAPTDTQKENIKQSLFGGIKANKGGQYYHWLPILDSCQEGAAINFRRVSTYDEADLNKYFGSPVIQVASPFLKDIISRFSSYYARQGQPDINFMI